MYARLGVFPAMNTSSFRLNLSPISTTMAILTISLKKDWHILQIARYLTLFFQCTEYVRSKRLFGGGVNAMMGAGFPVMAWGVLMFSKEIGAWAVRSKIGAVKNSLGGCLSGNFERSVS